MQFLQQYWWFVVALLGGILVLSLFVQGGQSLIFSISSDKSKRQQFSNAFGKAGIFSITAIVMFCVAIFASFPLFASVFFGGATYLWMTILLLIILSVIASGLKMLGCRSFGDFILAVDGYLLPFTIGVTFSTFFFGADFLCHPFHLYSTEMSYSVPTWNNPWHGLEAFADFRSIVLGISFVFISRCVALVYLKDAAGADNEIYGKMSKSIVLNFVLFLISFITFVSYIFMADGVKAMITFSQTGFMYPPYMVMREHAYLYNFLNSPLNIALAALCIVFYGIGFYKEIFGKSSKGFWFFAAGTVLAVMTMFLISGYANTSFYYSTTQINQSLTVANSSASEYTLRILMYVSFLIPFAAGFAIWACRHMCGRKDD